MGVVHCGGLGGASLSLRLEEAGLSLAQKISATEELLTGRMAANEQSLGAALEAKIKMLVEAVTNSRAA